jgi:uncharacterized protein (TIGR02466 family)
MINYWFPTGIYHAIYPEHETLKTELLSTIPIDVCKNQMADGWPFWTKQNNSSIINPLEIKTVETEKFSNWVVENVELFSRHYNSTASYEISQCWANVYQKGDFQEPHIHPGFMFSAVYFLSAPPGSGKLMFENPMLAFDMLPIKTNIETELNSTAAVYAPVEGQLVIFRSNLRHAVYPHNSDKPRISIAFNLTEKIEPR